MSDLKPNKFTVRGLASGFVNMAKPDTKYDPDGKFKIAIIADKADPRVRKIIAECDRVAGPALKAFQEAQAKLPPVKRHRGELQEQMPYMDLEDGTVLLKFSSKASGTKADGSRWERVIPHFGADGRIPPSEVPLYGEGSDVAISCTVSGFANKVAGNGASLRIEQVKIYTVERFGGGGASSDFEDDGEGYSGGAPAAEDDFENDGGGSGYTPDEDEQF